MLNTEESRAGAMACLEALRAIEKIAEGDNSCSSSMDRWWRAEDDAVATMLHAAGAPDGFMAGFISVFAEYVKADCSGCGYNLGDWKPEAAMTEEEKAKCRIEFNEYVMAGATA